MDFGKRFLIVVMGLVCLAWPPDAALAQLDQAQLGNLVSVLDMIRDRLAYHRILLDPDGRGRKHPRPGPNSFLSVPEEVEMALEYFLFAATADDRAKVESFLQTCKRLDSDTEAYIKTVQLEPNIESIDKFDKFDDVSRRKKIAALFKEISPTLPEKLQVSPVAIKARPLSGPPPKWVLDCGKPNCVSGKIKMDGDGGPFPSYAQGPSSVHASSGPPKARLTPEDARSAWAGLDQQYTAAQSQIDELRNHFLKQL